MEPLRSSSLPYYVTPKYKGNIHLKKAVESAPSHAKRASLRKKRK